MGFVKRLPVRSSRRGHGEGGRFFSFPAGRRLFFPPIMFHGVHGMMPS